MAKAKAKIAIVGGGIVGLGLAYAAVRRGIQVEVFERNERAIGASIRNFGMLWPIGQAWGKPFERSLRSRRLWGELAKEAGFWIDKRGSLLLARREDEWQLAQEFYETRQDKGYQLEVWSKEQVLAHSPAARKKGLIGGLFSATEAIVDPREAIDSITALLQEQYAVTFHFKHSIHPEKLQQLSQSHAHVFIASGQDLESLYPEILLESGITKVKLQMMATGPQPPGWHMGPAIYGGLTLQHYNSYAHCRLLPKLKKRIAEETPDFNQWGIHVMMAQNGLGELVIGDTHEYGHTHDPFIREEANQLVMDYLLEMTTFPQTHISRTWIGIYAKLAGKIDFIYSPEKNITLVNGLGGAGMTFSMGLGEEVIKNFFPY